MSNKLNVIFFATPDFAVPALEALSKANFCNIKAVVTQPDKPVGRHHSTPIPSPVKQAAQALKLPVLEGLEALKDLEADLGVVVAYGEILPQWVLDKFPLGILNIHPSLLPKYRGSSPIQAAILNRDEETGVTIIKLDNKMDHGPIVVQEHSSLPLPRGGPGWGPTAGELHDQLAELGANLLLKILPDYVAGKIKLQPQDASQATYTKKLTKEDGKIDWSKSPEQIEAHVRAMNPWPGAWTMWNEKKLIIWKVSLGQPSQSRPSPPPSPEGRGIILKEVQLEGKQRMNYNEFLKGHPNFSLD